MAGSVIYNRDYRLFVLTFVPDFLFSSFFVAFFIASPSENDKKTFPAEWGTPSTEMVGKLLRKSVSSSLLKSTEDGTYSEIIEPENMTASSPIYQSVDHLMTAWEVVYGLNSTDPMENPISYVYKGDIVPNAPHLEDCFSLTQERKLVDQRKPSLSLPEWALTSARHQDPRPPWIRGSNADNLMQTRLVQTQIWKNQFPENCSSNGVKFAIVAWKPVQGFGLGSALHIFSQMMEAALSMGRTVVPLPGSFSRAEKRLCPGEEESSFDCFFFPITSPECKREAISLWNGTNSDKIVEIKAYVKYATPTIHPSEEDKPWLLTQQTIENFTEMIGLEELPQKLIFWRSQVIRFMLRYPSHRLCHATNKRRHESFGREAAEQLIGSDSSQRRAETLLRSGAEFAALKAVKSEPTVDRHLLFDTPPFIPHPIVSVYVRQGDKATEMALASFASYMWLAEKLKHRVPNLENIWLSTEMETVVEESKNYSWWNFYYTKNKRQVGAMRMHDYTAQFGVVELTMLSFSNLIIAAECDYFVGPLASNWARLINELRLTNGKLKNGFLSVNFDDW